MYEIAFAKEGDSRPQSPSGLAPRLRWRAWLSAAFLVAPLRRSLLQPVEPFFVATSVGLREGLTFLFGAGAPIGACQPVGAWRPRPPR
jgi:hypothetical protein